MPTGSTEETDGMVLVHLYRSTNGNNWIHRDGWNGDNPDLGSWFGVQTNEDGRVVKLNLDDNNLQGTIPPQLGGLSALQSLSLRNNRLSGTIPFQLDGLRALKQLWLSNNQLSGTIPSRLGGLSALESLSLRHNLLSGAIPSELGRLSGLDDLLLNNNQLSGTVPSQLGGLSGLTALLLNNNQLSDLGDAQHALQLVSRFTSYKREGLELKDNPWKMPPEAVVEQGLDAIKTFLVDVQMASAKGAQVKSLQLLKVVLVGSASAGKTSLMRSIIEGAGSPTEGTLDKSSTVGIELFRHVLQGTDIEFYDCAGQVDYAGMHQTFLTRRALYLLVWDVTLFCNLGEISFKKTVDRHMMRWLYTLHLRAPGATVILVANKCDVSLADFAKTAEKVEMLVKRLLNEWQRRRRSNRRNNKDVTTVRLLDGVSRTSCADYGGIPGLVERISEQGATSIQVPPSWDLALKVIDVLRAGCDPSWAARVLLDLQEMRATFDETIEIVTNTFTTKKQLLELLQGISHQVGLQREEDMVTVSNVESALSGALWISEFAGQILRIDGEEGIFLDVVWLSKVLSPILSHKLHDEEFPKVALKKQRGSLVNHGVLKWDFALYLWKDVLTPAEQGLQGKVVESLFLVLLKLGVILPLGQPAFLANHRLSYTSRGNGESNDMLVIMRLPEECTEEQRRAINAAVAESRQDCREVKLKWKFDAARAPYGLVERLIASCHVIGAVEQDVCWRYGALFMSRQMTWRHGKQVRLFKFVVCYDDGMLILRMIGPLSNDRVWAALRYVASAMVILSMEWPGVQWEGWPDCPNHPQARMYLTPPGEARIGGHLLDQEPPDAHSMVCDCRRKTNGVLQLVYRRLGTVVDTREGHSVEGFEEENISPGKLECCREAFHFWRPKAWQTAASLGTLAVTIFCSVTIAGIVEEKNTLWITSLSVVALLLMAALIVSVLAYRDMSRNTQNRSNLLLATGRMV